MKIKLRPDPCKLKKDRYTKKKHTCQSLTRILCIIPILIYQICIAPYWCPCCRFQPTCSEFAKQAIFKYGLLKGTWLSIKRILKCHPYGKNGYDPVP